MTKAAIHGIQTAVAIYGTLDTIKTDARIYAVCNTCDADMKFKFKDVGSDVIAERAGAWVYRHIKSRDCRCSGFDISVTPLNIDRYIDVTVTVGDNNANEK